MMETLERKDGWAAPRLKDADLSLDKLREGYVEIIVAMRTLYQKCKLVHGDLSEYNILYYEGHLYIIDVSQAVDPDHPYALDFLRNDIIHVSDFFKKNGVGVMTLRELFDFIVDASIADDAVDNYLEKVQQNILARGDVSVEDEIADWVFAQSYIPKTLDDVKNAEEDVQRITSGKDIESLYYPTITGLKHALTEMTSHLENDAESESQSDEDEDNESDSEEISCFESDPDTPLDKKSARKVARKENKKKVKEEKREARKTKVPKAVKKRKKKLSKSHKTR
ncbi:serine/threonine-protein kinase RIO1-like protein [Trifolium pratense]|uniref:non-specific serine/threonine protein kinase n=1 Tax=Trifolium pratense TaxID=57577 RepID=A0A2K3KXZ6_TRIPR|nr:serine/threonine-protein kinase RIO1-like protein [Trifolium pratense]